MLLAVDIGNTNIVLGFLENNRIVGTYRMTTKSNHTSDEYGIMIAQFLHLSGFTINDVEDVIVASVVPKVMHSFRASIIKFLHIAASFHIIFPAVFQMLRSRSHTASPLCRQNHKHWYIPAPPAYQRPVCS